MKVNHLVFLFMIMSLIACVPTTNTGRSDVNSSDTTDISKRHQVSLIEVSNNEMTINGTNLSTVTSVKSKYGPQVINFNILSKSNNTLRLSVPNGMKLLSGFIYDLVITDAFGQSTTSISFDVQNDSISTSKIQDGSITNSKLSSLGASSAGQVLQYDGTSWVAVNYTGGSNYLGRIEVDPGGGITQPSISGLNNGDFYVVNDAAPITGDLNGDGNIETYTAGDIIRFNSITGKWDLQSGSGSYVGPWSVSGSDILRTGTGQVTISENPVAGPAKFNLGRATVSPATAEDSILFNIGGDVPFGITSNWSRAMSFGLRQEQNATMGIFSTTNTNQDQAEYFFIDVDRQGSLDPDFWNNAELYISMDGEVGIGSTPSGSYTFETYGNGRFSTNLDVDGTITAAALIGDGSGITNVNATNMTNTGTTTIRGGGSGTGDVAFQSVTSDYVIYDENGYLSFGHSANSGDYTATAQLDVRSNAADAVGQFYSYGGNQSSINLASSRGTTTAAANTGSGDVLGQFNFGGDVGTGIANSASIRATATEGFSATNLGTQLSFSTTANTTSTLQENMLLTHDGRLLVGNSAIADGSTNTLVVGGDTQINNNVTVAGTSSFANVSMTGSLTQGGTSVFNNTIDVNAVATVDSLVSEGGITNTGLLDNNGNADISGTLLVSGLASLTGGATITGGNLAADTITVNSITGSSTATFGVLTASDRVVATGASNEVVFKGGTDDNFEILVDDSTGIHLGNINTGGSVTSALPISFYTDDAERMKIMGTGNVGIGSAAPTERLHVVGNLRVEGSTDCTLGGGAGATNCTSDKRLKDNVVNIDNALDKIKALNGVEFDWNEKSVSPGKHSIGVIAQDVQRQFPTAVIENSEGWLAVDYAVLVSPLIEAVKELDKNLDMYKTMSEGMSESVIENTRQIASLKEDNEVLKNQVKELKDENKQMKKALCSLNSNFEFCQ
ncbi:tail fiber domain-containing protein [Halobacteriovorax sp.]|uniref:tail fiber domain-containing protein n=1 Tax=Halobacteriovorax sp. TaxID=2020862 RepID=UPI003AF24069